MQSSTVVGSTGHQTPVQLKWMFINTCTPSVSINHCYQVHFRQNKNYSIYIDSDGIWQKKNGEAGGLSFWSSGAGVAVKYLVIKSEGWCQCTAVVGHHWWLLVMSWWWLLWIISVVVVVWSKPDGDWSRPLGTATIPCIVLKLQLFAMHHKW